MEMNEYAKALLSLFDIKVKDNCLVKMTTNMAFTQMDTRERYASLYCLNDTEVKLYAVSKSDECYKVSVTVDGFEYSVLCFSHERFEDRNLCLTVKDLNTGESLTLTVKPKIDVEFINTVILYNDGSRDGGPVNVTCCLDGYIYCDMGKYSSGGSWGEKYTYGEKLNVEEYVKLVRGVIDYSLWFYCQSLCMAFAKVSEIIAMAYNEFIDYPRSSRDVFIKGFYDAANDLYSSMLTRILQTRVSFIDIMPKTPEEMLERTKRYVAESMKLNQYVGEIANEKAKVDETLLKNLQLLNKFIEDASRGRDDGKNKNVRK